MSELLMTESSDGIPSESYDSKYTVLIDTNGFMIPVQFGVDIFSELKRLGFSEFLTVEAVLLELEKLSKTASGNDRTAAKVALSLSRQCRILQNSGKKTGKYADDIIIESAVRHSLSVLTNDAGLRQKLIKCGVSVVSMRQTKRLDFVTQK